MSATGMSKLSQTAGVDVLMGKQIQITCIGVAFPVATCGLRDLKQNLS